MQMIVDVNTLFLPNSIRFLIHKFHSYSNATSTTVLSNHVSNVHRINITTERNELKQQKLTDIFLSSGNKVQVHKPTTPSDERYILARRLILWIARDLLPLSMVHYQGFNDFWRSLRNDIPLPTRQTIAIAALDDMYDIMKKELISKISTNGGKIHHLSLKYCVDHAINFFIPFIPISALCDDI